MTGNITVTAIGGPYDRQVLSGRGPVRSWPEPLRAMRFEDWRTCSFSTEQVTTRNHRYEAFPFRYRTESGNQHEWTFWVHESLTRDEAMVKIMDGYGVNVTK